MKIKNMFWKLFWLMLRGKGNTRILFASEAVCFKAHMIEITDAYFNPEEGGGLGDHLSLHWDGQKDQYVRLSGDIDDIQAVIKHVTGEDDEYEMSDEDFAQLKAEAEKHDDILDKIVKVNDKEDLLDTLDAHMIGSVKFDVKKYIADLKKTDLADLVKPEVDKYLDSKPEMTQEEINSLINDASDSLAEKLERFKNFSQTEEDARAILKDVEKI